MSLDRQPQADPDGSDQLLRMFVESVHDYAVLLLDPTGKIVSWNIGAQRIKGYAADEILGRHFSCFYPSADIAAGKPEHELEIAARTGRFEDIGARVRKDGSHFVANVVISAIRDPSGTLQGFGKITRDITELNAAQERIKSSESRLKSLVDTVLDTLVDGVVTINSRGEIQSYNKACLKLFGYAADEVIGKNVRILMPPPYRDEHDSYLDNYRNSGIAKIIGIGREVIGQRKDGSTFPMELAVGATAQGGDHAFVGIIRDITSRREGERVREQFRQAQKMEAIGNLTGGMAHDFNNLLGIIIGNLDLARPLVQSSGDADELVGEALAAATKGADLTRRLLAFARRQPLQPKVIELNEIIRELFKLLSRTLGENIAISFNLAFDLWPVLVDPAQLGAALTNLATNARDAMPKGGKLLITTANRDLDADYTASHPGAVPGDYAMVEVSDSGIGMEPAVMEQIFVPFYTTKERGQGTGLGLSMVFGFIEQSGGHINVYSELGKGTTFRLYLRRVAREPDETPMKRPIAENPPQGGGETILAVEDNAALRRVVVRQLKELGYRVIEVNTAAAALAILESQKVDALFTDIIMPGGMDGFELARAVSERWPAVAVILTSGFPEAHVNGNLESRALSARLLSKPYRKEDLAHVLREALLKSTS